MEYVSTIVKFVIIQIDNYILAYSSQSSSLSIIGMLKPSLLTDQIRDGLLHWSVPQGIWRIFVIFETHNDGGRRYFMDLLNPVSVALNIETIYQPHYEHLKEEVGKTWLGFFYDEAEMGNLLEYCCQILPGKKRNFEGESLALPWSGQAAEIWQDIWQQDYRKVLPPYADDEKVMNQLQHPKEKGAFAVGMDIDHSFSRNGENDICIGERNEYGRNRDW